MSNNKTKEEQEPLLDFKGAKRKIKKRLVHYRKPLGILTLFLAIYLIMWGASTLWTIHSFKADNNVVAMYKTPMQVGGEAMYVILSEPFKTPTSKLTPKLI